MDLESLSRRPCQYHLPTFGQQRPDEALHLSFFGGTHAAHSAMNFGMSDKALNSFRHTPVVSANGSLVFPHDPIPHVRNRLCVYKGLQIEGRWTTKDGQRVMSLCICLFFFNLFLMRLSGLCNRAGCCGFRLTFCLVQFFFCAFVYGVKFAIQ